MSLQMNVTEKVRMGEAGRRAYLERDASFAPRLLAAVHELVAGPRRAGHGVAQRVCRGLNL